MKKLLYVAMTLVLALLVKQKAFGNDVVSANGFVCSSKSRFVSCEGFFPGHPIPVLNFVGLDSAEIFANFDDFRWNYSSETGCLCRIGFGGNNKVATSLCTSHIGIKKLFNRNDTDHWLSQIQMWCKNH